MKKLSNSHCYKTNVLVSIFDCLNLFELKKLEIQFIGLSSLP